MKIAIIGLEMALKAYPNCTNGTRLPETSESLPKYPLLNPAVASATPSNMPINTIEKPIDFKYTGMTGYSISLAVSVSKLTIDKIQTVRVICFTILSFNPVWLCQPNQELNRTTTVEVRNSNRDIFVQFKSLSNWRVKILSI